MPPKTKISSSTYWFLIFEALLRSFILIDSPPYVCSSTLTPNRALLVALARKQLVVAVIQQTLRNMAVSFFLFSISFSFFRIILIRRKKLV